MFGNILGRKKGLSLDRNIETFSMESPETLLDPHGKGSVGAGASEMEGRPCSVSSLVHKMLRKPVRSF